MMHTGSQTRPCAVLAAWGSSGGRDRSGVEADKSAQWPGWELAGLLKAQPLVERTLRHRVIGEQHLLACRPVWDQRRLQDLRVVGVGGPADTSIEAQHFVEIELARSTDFEASTGIRCNRCDRLSVCL